jgi:hypothetical protein
MYYPWISVADLSGSGSSTKMIPPSGYMVGIYNRSDAERGVHKAPANEVVLGAIDLELHLSKGEQDTLNPLGVNCIRSFPSRGIRVWGARTLSSDGAWRYVSVRRLFILAEASLDAGMQWVVFEPNDRTLWAKVRRDVTAFLKVIWLGGALFGNTPEEAFYVKCDDELNPREIRDLGQLIIEVGLAPVRPAEFVIFRLTVGRRQRQCKDTVLILSDIDMANGREDPLLGFILAWISVSVCCFHRMLLRFEHGDRPQGGHLKPGGGVEDPWAVEIRTSPWAWDHQLDGYLGLAQQVEDGKVDDARAMARSPYNWHSGGGSMGFRARRPKVSGPANLTATSWAWKN